MKTYILLIILSVYFISARSLFGNEYSVDRIIVSSTDKTDEFNHLRYDVKDSGNNLLYSVDKFVPYDLPFPSAKVFDDGSLILCRAFDSGVEFYNGKGEKAWETVLLKNASPEWERTIHSSVGTTFFVLAVSDVAMRFCPVFLFNKAGEKIAEYSLDRESVYGLQYSPYEDIFAIGSGWWIGNEFGEETFVFNTSFELIAEYSATFKVGDFSSNGIYFLGNKGWEYFKADLKNNKIVWRKKPAAGGLVFDVRFAGEKIVVISYGKPELIANEWTYNKLTIELLDKDGRTEISKTKPMGNIKDLDFEELRKEILK